MSEHIQRLHIVKVRLFFFTHVLMYFYEIKCQLADIGEHCDSFENLTLGIMIIGINFIKSKNDSKDVMHTHLISSRKHCKSLRSRPRKSIY